MTTDHRAEIDAFFASFAHASDTEDWAAYGGMFIEQFMNLDPTDAVPVKRDDLIAFLPHRRSLFESAGANGTELVDLQVQSLDDTHALARTKWRVLFDHERDPVELDTTFLLRREDRWRIVVYLNHGSLPELLGLATG